MLWTRVEFRLLFPHCCEGFPSSLTINIFDHELCSVVRHEILHEVCRAASSIYDLSPKYVKQRNIEYYNKLQNLELLLLQDVEGNTRFSVDLGKPFLDKIKSFNK